MDELAHRLRRRSDRAADPQRARASTPRPAIRSRAATSSSACARVPSASAGTSATRARARAARAAWLVGTGVAASTYPARRRPSQARGARARRTARFVVAIGAADIGTGARTALTQIAADALGVDAGPRHASSSATRACRRRRSPAARWAPRSWGSAVVKACRQLRGDDPGGDEVAADTSDDVEADARARARTRFGAQFVEVAGRRRHRRGPRPAAARRVRRRPRSSTRGPRARSSSAG